MAEACLVAALLEVVVVGEEVEKAVERDAVLASGLRARAWPSWCASKGQVTAVLAEDDHCCKINGSPLC
jgi:hypothetical protein